ncbi:MAG: class I SAM-dependent methyltransferase [Propioniciclava sp.]|uniref:class I SAM-dependent methyltransferase n=1 Tax=Propioniciclava sp. TaxID=2038686 RepID=UPI0039E284D4
MHRIYFPDYDERWQLVIDRVKEVVPGEGRILDLGCGPGTLTGRLGDALPEASVLGVDAHPALIAMARAGHPGVSFVEAFVGAPDAEASLKQLGPFDAIVSSAFVHYFDPDGVVSLLRGCRGLLTPHGVLVTAEQFVSGEPSVGDGNSELPDVNPVARQKQFTDGVSADVEADDSLSPWTQWWADTSADVEIVALTGPIEVPLGSSPLPMTLSDFVEALGSAGFRRWDALYATGKSVVVTASIA